MTNRPPTGPSLSGSRSGVSSAAGRFWKSCWSSITFEMSFVSCLALFSSVSSDSLPAPTDSASWLSTGMSAVRNSISGSSGASTWRATGS
ncbi:MAG: hypothetical protein AVDCRST_MAG24-554 [uncultured Nocardioidaceae bacterium]|uniref:Uncharacterized protein n=1 Tax=uncultured Nocardioidaceae bacterium TaxID=253824 RepID=A0A6J4L934_9ACTN|nr:MAG: hypothetical protein AVDCRST_MAG24-554 [uncultured Nocardioidaceae bacterium]